MSDLGKAHDALQDIVHEPPGENASPSEHASSETVPASQAGLGPIHLLSPFQSPTAAPDPAQTPEPEAKVDAWFDEFIQMPPDSPRPDSDLDHMDSPRTESTGELESQRTESARGAEDGFNNDSWVYQDVAPTPGLPPSEYDEDQMVTPHAETVHDEEADAEGDDDFDYPFAPTPGLPTSEYGEDEIPTPHPESFQQADTDAEGDVDFDHSFAPTPGLPPSGYGSDHTEWPIAPPYQENNLPLEDPYWIREHNMEEHAEMQRGTIAPYGWDMAGYRMDSPYPDLDLTTDNQPGNQPGYGPSEGDLSAIDRYLEGPLGREAQEGTEQTWTPWVNDPAEGTTGFWHEGQYPNPFPEDQASESIPYPAQEEQTPDSLIDPILLAIDAYVAIEQYLGTEDTNTLRQDVAAATPSHTPNSLDPDTDTSQSAEDSKSGDEEEDGEGNSTPTGPAETSQSGDTDQGGDDDYDMCEDGDGGSTPRASHGTQPGADTSEESEEDSEMDGDEQGDATPSASAATPQSTTDSTQSGKHDSDMQDDKEQTASPAHPASPSPQLVAPILQSTTITYPMPSHTRQKSSAQTQYTQTNGYPRPDVHLPGNLTLEQICFYYPNHVGSHVLRGFLEAGWNGPKIWAHFPQDFKDNYPTVQPHAAKIFSDRLRHYSIKLQKEKARREKIEEAEKDRRQRAEDREKAEKAEKAKGQLGIADS